MHPNPIFRGEDIARNIKFARDRGFGILSINGEDAPLMAHVPFELAEDGTELHLHLVRSNPIWRALTEPSPAVIAVSGPDGYVSPDWYGVPDQVPTWNYVAVHLRGVLHPLSGAALKGVLDAASAHFEAQLAPKRPWTSDKMAEGTLDRMMRQIMPCRLDVTEIQGTWKLGQNKPAAARRGAADQIATGLGQSLDKLSVLMRDVPDH